MDAFHTLQTKYDDTNIYKKALDRNISTLLSYGIARLRTGLWYHLRDLPASIPAIAVSVLIAMQGLGNVAARMKIEIVPPTMSATTIPRIICPRAFIAWKAMRHSLKLLNIRYNSFYVQKLSLLWTESNGTYKETITVHVAIIVLRVGPDEQEHLST